MLVPLSVRDVMVTPVETVTPDTTLAAAARRLRSADVTSVVVGKDAPVGIVTESDVVDVVARGVDPESVTVEEAMSAPLVTIGPEATIERAAELLRDNGIRRLPVVDGEELVGILTSADLSYFLPHFAARRRTATPVEHPAEDVPADWEFVFEGERPLSVGDRVRFRKALSPEDVEAFARATGDTNPVHLDDDFAAETQFGRRIAHGVLTAGVVSAALARLPGLVIYLGQDLRFLAPVDVDATLTAVCEVTESLGGDRYRLSTAVFDGDGQRVLAGEATVLVTDAPEKVTAA